MNNEKPVYEIHIDARGCYFEVLVNGVPLYFHYNLGATSFRIPINNYITKTGKQEIRLKILSVDGKPFPGSTEVSLTIDEYSKGMPKERKSIFIFKTPVFDTTNRGIDSFSNVFMAKVPYELVDWQTGIDLTKESREKLQKELENAYKEYTLAFKTKDLNSYKQLTKLRQENAFTSMYYDEEQKEKAEKSYLDGLNNEKVMLYPLENYQVVFYGDGKLVGLQKPKDAPGIYIDNENKKDAFMEYILFYRRTNSSPLEIIF